jgi:hypothetical protein
MQKGEIIKMYQVLNAELSEFLTPLTKEEKSVDLEGKWSVNQNIDHLNKVLIPLTKALSKPKFLLRYGFGKPNRPGRNYEALVQRYHEKAQGPAVAPEIYKANENRNLATQDLEGTYQALSLKFLKIVERKWSEAQLDNYLLAHPLLGKLTIREILYFVHWHTNHHFEAIQKIRN